MQITQTTLSVNLITLNNIHNGRDTLCGRIFVDLLLNAMHLLRRDKWRNQEKNTSDELQTPQCAQMNARTTNDN